MKLTKRVLVARISDETGIAPSDCQLIIQQTLDHISRALAAGDNVEFRNFGVFEVQVHAPRVGRNPKKPEETCTIPRRKVVKFKSGRVLEKLVSGEIVPPEQDADGAPVSLCVRRRSVGDSKPPLKFVPRPEVAE